MACIVPTLPTLTFDEIRQLKKLLRQLNRKGVKVTLKARKTTTQIVGRLKAR